MSYAEEGKCCICKGKYRNWGNNPQPVRNMGRCCDSCNDRIVIPERIFRLQQGKPIY